MRKRHNGYKIPLYNCYWCRCGHCLRRSEPECFEKCRICYLKDRFRMPEYCDRFVDDTKENKELYKEIQRCENCEYKKVNLKIKGILEKI